MPGLKSLDEIVNGLEVGATTIVDFVVGFAFEGLELAGADLELVHVLAEMTDMIAHGRPEALSRIDDPLEADSAGPGATSRRCGAGSSRGALPCSPRSGRSRRG